MDDQSSSDTIPYNEIDNAHVAMEHEAKVSKISEEQLYYLMSRGIPRKQAERMVIRGFLGAVLSAIPAADVRNKLVEILERKLTDGQQYQ